jgi:enterochelin esterase-like enzyme
MVFRVLLLIICSAISLVTRAQDFPLPYVKNGTIERMHFRHNYFDRQVDIWLPDGFVPHKKTDVIIMHDGQMLFDSTITWNHQEWRVDECLTKLRQEGWLRNQVMVIGIHNDPMNRYREFFPNDVYSYLHDSLKTKLETELWHGTPTADLYLANIMELVLPMIEKKFEVQSTRNRHFMVGASMGALISYYGLTKYPKELNGIAGLSIHLPMINAQQFDQRYQSKMFEALLAYTTQAGQWDKNRKSSIWIDRGTLGLDSLYSPYFEFFCRGMMQHLPKNNRVNCQVFQATGHNERDWSSRTALLFRWLLNEKGRKIRP